LEGRSNTTMTSPAVWAGSLILKYSSAIFAFMKRKIELLAPGGDIDSIKAAIIAGVDATYCGLEKFNARNRATNIALEDLNGILNLAHENNCKVFLTLNIIIVASEISALISLLNKLISTSLDGVIVQDFGLFYLLSKYYKNLKIHTSTQNFPLNLKDNSAYFDIGEISDAGVASLKIEGRIKKFGYVYTVVDCWKKQLRSFYNQNKIDDDNSDLYKVFNRDFSNSYLKGDINKNMFIDNPRDNSIKHLSEIHEYSTNNKIEKGQIKLYEEKEEVTTNIKNKLKRLSIAKAPLIISISGKLDTPLKVSVKTPNTSFIVFSEINLVNAAKCTPNRHSRNQRDEAQTISTGSKIIGKNFKKNTVDCLNYDVLMKRFRALNNTAYYIKHLELENLQDDLFISFKVLTSIKKKILSILNGSNEIIDPIDVPFLKKPSTLKIKPTLAVLISSQKDLNFCNKTSANIFFQLPNCFKNNYFEFIDIFFKNKRLIPWFPSILIGENYTDAVEFLKQVQPKLIVTNNTGIAYEAYKRGIPWLAGPYLNIVNSFSLLCLKDNFNCHGSFISNEISKNQIKGIICPENFKLYYSIYHPILLLTSRQCLLHQIIGCKKNSINEDCIQKCNKFSSITNLKKVSFFIEKTKGNYHSIYNNYNFLNTDIVSDLPDIFSCFLIDLRDIKTETKIDMDKSRIIKLFENLLNGNPQLKKELKQMIHPSTNAQYKKGI